MSTSTIANRTTTDETARKRSPRWQTMLVWGSVIALFVVGIGMRLYDLRLPFDRDGYDEGVYWQSLLAMRAGHALYQQIFYSQPPFFLLSLYPSFMLFGSTLWSARFGIALVSLFGLLGAVLLGKALSGRTGAVLCLLLLIVDPYFLLESQTIQAESSSVAFSILAVGLAYLWWEQPEGVPGLCWAALTGITLSLGILCKLLGILSLVPVALLMLARLWQIWQKQPGTRLASLRPILLGIAACVVTMLLALLPFLNSSLLQEVVGFHIQSASVFSRLVNTAMIGGVVVSVLGVTAFYGMVAALLRRDWRVIPLVAWLLATILMLWRLAPLLSHHMVALTPPLIALAVIGIAMRRGPIMNSHETAWASRRGRFIVPTAEPSRIVPTSEPSRRGRFIVPTADLSAQEGQDGTADGLTPSLPDSEAWHPQGPPTSAQPPRATTFGDRPTPNDGAVGTQAGRRAMRVGPRFIVGPRGALGGGWALVGARRDFADGPYTPWITPIAILLILVTTAFNIQRDVSYYNTMTTNSMTPLNQLQVRVAADLREAITPDQLVVTDAQFIAGLADRSTPPALVDTSTVRINDGSLTLPQLINETSQPQVHAVLFFTARFYLPNVARFHAWVAQHFHLLHTYGHGHELWVR